MFSYINLLCCICIEIMLDGKEGLCTYRGSLLQSTGVAFPEVTTFWQGEKFRCLGAGNRKKKIAFVGVKVFLPLICCKFMKFEAIRSKAHLGCV